MGIVSKWTARGLALVAILGLAVVSAGSARASVVYQFTIDHCTGGCGTGPYGSVTVSQDGSDLDFAVAMTGGDLIKTGAGLETFSFQLTTGGLAITKLTSGFSVDSASPPYKNDGFGNFNYGIVCDVKVPATCGTTLNFTVVGADLNMLGVSVGGSAQVFAAADIISDTTGNTGPVGTGPACIPGQVGCPNTQDTPEPASLALLGVALFGLGAVRRRYSI